MKKEQLNKELRVYFPKGTDFREVSQADLDRVADNLRTAPMRCLDWMTPQEAFEFDAKTSKTGVLTQNFPRILISIRCN